MTDNGEDKSAREEGKRFSRAYMWSLTIVGIALYVAAVWFIGWQRIQEELANARVGPLVAALGLLTIGLWIRVAKWRYALGRGVGAARLFFLSRAGGNLTPSRIGELSPLFLKRYRSARIGAWVVFDRVIEGFMTLFLGALGLFGVAAFGPWTASGAVIVVLAAWALTLYVATRESLAQRFASWMKWKPLRAFANLLPRLSEAAVAYRKHLVFLVTVTLIGKLFDLSMIVAVYAAFDESLSLSLAASGKGALGLVSAVPITPSTSGVPHLTMAAWFHEFGGFPADIVAAAVAVEVVVNNVVFWSNFGVGLRVPAPRSAPEDSEN